MKLKYESVFSILERALKISGTHPDTKITKQWFIPRLLLGTQFTSMFLTLLYGMCYHSLKNNDFNKLCQDAILAEVYVVILLQYFTILSHRKTLKKLMTAIALDYELSKLLPLKDQMIVEKYALKGQRIIKQWLILTVLGGSLFPIKNILLILFTWFQTGYFETIPMYELNYIFSYIEDNKDTVLGWFLSFIYLNTYTVISATVYVSFVPLGPSFMLHVCGQLELIKNRIDILFETDDVNQIKYNLKCIIKQMQYVYSFVNELGNIVQVAYEMTLKGASVIIPITAFQLRESLEQGDYSMEFLAFLFGGVLIVADPCYYSDLLMEKGEDVKMALYSCGWQKLHDRSIRSIMTIVLIRTQRPIVIKTPFSLMNLSKLADVFHQAYALFNLMSAAWK